MRSDTALKSALERRRRDIENSLETQLASFRDQRALAAGCHAPDGGLEVEIWEETEVALLEMRLETLDKIETALESLAAGRYGRCVDCAQEIGEALLRVLPLALRCEACEERREETERQRRAFDRLFALMTTDRPM